MTISLLTKLSIAAAATMLTFSSPALADRGGKHHGHGYHQHHHHGHGHYKKYRYKRHYGHHHNRRWHRHWKPRYYGWNSYRRGW